MRLPHFDGISQFWMQNFRARKEKLILQLIAHYTWQTFSTSFIFLRLSPKYFQGCSSGLNSSLVSWNRCGKALLLPSNAKYKHIFEQSDISRSRSPFKMGITLIDISSPHYQLELNSQIGTFYQSGIHVSNWLFGSREVTTFMPVGLNALQAPWPSIRT